MTLFRIKSKQPFFGLHYIDTAFKCGWGASYLVVICLKVLVLSAERHVVDLTPSRKSLIFIWQKVMVPGHYLGECQLR